MDVHLPGQSACLPVYLSAWPPTAPFAVLIAIKIIGACHCFDQSFRVAAISSANQHRYRRMASGNMFGEVDDWDDGKVFGGLDEEGEPEDGSVAAGSAPTGKGRKTAKAKPGAKAKISKEKNQGLLRVPMFCSEGPQLEVLPWPQSRIGCDEVSSATLKHHGGLQIGDEWRVESPRGP